MEVAKYWYATIEGAAKGRSGFAQPPDAVFVEGVGEAVFGDKDGEMIFAPEPVE